MDNPRPMMQTPDGRWVPAVPLPYAYGYGWRWSVKVCGCGSRFLRRSTYEAHYRTVHLATLLGPEASTRH